MVKTSEPDSLSSARTEKSRRVIEFQRGLENSWQYFHLTKTAHRHEPSTLVPGALRLLSGYDMDPHFSSDPERNLWILATVDAWLSLE